MPQEAEQRKTIINVTGVTSDEKKITLLDGKLKFFFWRTKQDGNPTKANAQFEQLLVQAGKAYEAEVEFEDKEFVNEKGKTIKFTSRKILYFYTGSPSEPKNEGLTYVMGQKSSFTPSAELKALESRVVAGFKKRDDRINELEVRVGVLEAEIMELRNN
jgi:hypothetical protein